MIHKIPPISVIKSQLDRLNQAGVRELSALSGVPYHTILKIKSGETKNPGFETVRNFVKHIKLNKYKRVNPEIQDVVS